MSGRSRFITVEGLEGAGKTTCLAGIEQYLRGRGLDPVMTREPGGTPLGEAIRELLLGFDHAGMSADAETLLVFAARAEHLAKVIRPALSAGRTVVCDRFTDATYAYQGGGRGLGEARIEVLESWVQQGLARAGRRSAPDRFEQERLEFFERARAMYRERAQRMPERIVMIDASVPADEVLAAITAALERLLDGIG